MKTKLVCLLLLTSLSVLLQGCIAFPPLISVEHKESPANANANAEIMRRLDAIDRRLDQMEKNQDRSSEKSSDKK
jgi:hypothetical protein